MARKTIYVFVLLLLVSIPSFGQGGHQITGSDNFVSAVKQSLSQIPYLKIGNLSGNVSHHAYIEAQGISYFTKGRMSLDYLEITMPDGKVFRYNYSSGKGFTCPSLPGGLGYIQIDHLATAVKNANSIGKNISLGSYSDNVSFPLYGDVKNSHVYGIIPYTELGAYGETLDSNGNKVFLGNPNDVQNVLAKKPSVNVTSSGLSSKAFNEIKRLIDLTRDAYSKWQQQNQANNKTATSTNNYSSNQSYSNTNTRESNRSYNTQSSNNSSNTNTNYRQQQVQEHNDALLAQGTAIYNSTKHLGNPFYNNSVQIWPSNTETAQQIAEREAEEEWEWQQRQRRLAEEEARWEREQAERERLEREEAERQRLEREAYRKKQAQEEADRKARYADWERTTKFSFDEKLNAWKNEANTYINTDLKKYRFFDGDRLPHWIDFYSAAVKKIVASTEIPSEEKIKRIHEIALKVYNYYDICKKFNFEGQLEKNTWQSINTVYLYAKYSYGYSPESQAYNYLINHPKIEPLPKEKITTDDKNINDALAALRSLYRDNSYASTFIGAPEVFYKKQYHTVYGLPYKKPSIDLNSGTVLLPVKKGYLQSHKQFLNEAIETLSGDTRTININPSVANALEMLAYSNFYEGKPQAALAYFETILEMFNIYSIDDYIEKVKHNGYSNTLRIDSNTKELRTTPNFTASLAFAYHYSGFYEDSYKLFEHASLAVSKVSQGIGYSNDRSSLPGWNMFPSPKTTYVYWEYRSMMIESLFLQKKHDLALQAANNFITKINSSFLNKAISPFAGASKQTLLSRLYSTYPKIYGDEIHTDHQVANSFVRTILYQCNILIKNGFLEEAKVAFEPISELLKKRDADLTYFGDYQELGLSLMKELDPKLYNKKYADLTPKKTIDYFKPTSVSEWEQSHIAKAETLQELFDSKNYTEALATAIELAYTIDYGDNMPDLYFKSMLLGTQAALYTKHYFEGILLAQLGQSFSQEYANLIKPYLLTNALLAGKADVYFEGMEKYEGADLMKDRYAIERELTVYSKTKIDNSYGFEELVKIEKTLANNQVDSPYLCNLYNAIRFGEVYAKEKELQNTTKNTEKDTAVKVDGEKFLEANKNKNGIIITESGLQYIVLKEGTGKKPTLNSKVKVHYHGTVIDGTVFDSSMDRGEPSIFPLDKVIKGWTEGLQLMPIGSKYKFFIPQELAYGPKQAGALIKPFSVLIFEVELLDIVE